jgi:hypothetical protein
MDRVFVVMGSSGEYSDHSSWTVRAFETASEADAYVVLCEAAARSQPRRPSYDHRVAGARERFDTVDYPAYQEAQRQWAATAPDPSCPTYGDRVDYSVDEIPFGLESTALQTAPPRLSNRRRHYDLTAENEP